ncbi:MAG: hypothetical protein MJ075_05425 [Oscillospiraceae bacterium]|nr:hypothetical protein [Oscillospiraceae bacterium]
MAQYLPTYPEALELKKHLSDAGLAYVHFHDQCGYSYFQFDAAGEEGRAAAAAFWQAKGMDVSFQEDGLTFIIIAKE